MLSLSHATTKWWTSAWWLRSDKFSFIIRWKCQNRLFRSDHGLNARSDACLTGALSAQRAVHITAARLTHIWGASTWRDDKRWRWFCAMTTDWHFREHEIMEWNWSTPAYSCQKITIGRGDGEGVGVAKGPDVVSHRIQYTRVLSHLTVRVTVLYPVPTSHWNTLHN